MSIVQGIVKESATPQMRIVSEAELGPEELRDLKHSVWASALKDALLSGGSSALLTTALNQGLYPATGVAGLGMVAVGAILGATSQPAETNALEAMAVKKDQEAKERAAAASA